MKQILYAMLTAGSLMGAGSAHAIDGCKVTLCVAGNWRHISECTPVVEQALRDVARGRSWPTCSMSSAPPAPGAPTPGVTSSTWQWPTEETCPPFYSNYSEESGRWMSCQFSGIISVVINGQPWADTFASFSGGATSTRYYDPARAALGSGIDPRYDEDAAAWTPPAPPPETGPER